MTIISNYLSVFYIFYYIYILYYIQVVESDAFDYLDGPILRITGVDVPMPFAEGLEAAAQPSPNDVIRGVKKLLNIK